MDCAAPGQYMKLARKIFAEEGVPLDITWLGQVESAWKAESGFVGGSVRTVAVYSEHRSHVWLAPERLHRRAQQYRAGDSCFGPLLKDLARRYNGNWELAMAAYNTGAGNIDRAISRAGTANFWMIYPYIAQETRNYVPNILAVILIAKNPEKYGFKGIKPDAPMVV